MKPFKLTYRYLLWIGILLEVLIFVISYVETDGNQGETYRLSARYSGKLSMLFFTWMLFYFSYYWHNTIESITNNKQSLLIYFAVLHLIHFYFLAASVHLNHSPLDKVKLVGGFFAYMLIVFYPFVLLYKNVVKKWESIYFFYVWFVFFITYVMRITGFKPTGNYKANFIDYTSIALLIIVLATNIRYRKLNKHL